MKKAKEIKLENRHIPEALKQIKNNFIILMSFGEIENGKCIYASRDELQQRGFDFDRYTSVGDFENKNYKFCYERGWTDNGNDTIAIIEVPGQTLSRENG